MIYKPTEAIPRFLPNNIPIINTANGCSVIGIGYKGTLILAEIINIRVPKSTVIGVIGTFLTILFVIDKVIGLRVDKDAEAEGLDINQHGERIN